MLKRVIGEEIDGGVSGGGFGKMLMFGQFGLLVIERFRKWMLFSDSIVGLSWMLLWIVSTQCRIFSGLVRVES